MNSNTGSVRTAIGRLSNRFRQLLALSPEGWTGRWFGLDPLEPKILLSISPVLVDGVPTFTGDGANDTLILRISAGGDIEYSLDNGSNFSTDIGGQNIAAAGALVQVDLGGGTNALEVHDETGEDFLHVRDGIVTLGEGDPLVIHFQNVQELELMGLAGDDRFDVSPLQGTAITVSGGDGDDELGVDPLGLGFVQGATSIVLDGGLFEPVHFEADVETITTLLTADQVAALAAGLEELALEAEKIQDLDSFRDSLPLLDPVGAELGELFGFEQVLRQLHDDFVARFDADGDGIVDTTNIEQVRQFLRDWVPDLAAGAGEATDAFTTTQWTIGVEEATLEDAGGDTVKYRFRFTSSRSVTVELADSDVLADRGLYFGRGTTIDARGQFTLDFVFGLDGAGAFFIDDMAIDHDGHAINSGGDEATQAQPATIDGPLLVGMMDLRVEAGVIETLSAQGQVAFEAVGGGGRDRTAIATLAAGAAATMDRGVEAALPIVESDAGYLSNFTPTAGIRLALTMPHPDGGPFDPEFRLVFEEPDPLNPGAFVVSNELTPATLIRPNLLQGLLNQFRDWMTRLSESRLLALDIPFATDTTLGDALGFGQAFGSQLLEPLRDHDGLLLTRAATQGDQIALGADFSFTLELYESDGRRTAMDVTVEAGDYTIDAFVAALTAAMNDAATDVDGRDLSGLVEAYQEAGRNDRIAFRSRDVDVVRLVRLPVGLNPNDAESPDDPRSNPKVAAFADSFTFGPVVAGFNSFQGLADLLTDALAQATNGAVTLGASYVGGDDPEFLIHLVLDTTVTFADVPVDFNVELGDFASVKSESTLGFTADLKLDVTFGVELDADTDLTIAPQILTPDLPALGILSGDAHFEIRLLGDDPATLGTIETGHEIVKVDVVVSPDITNLTLDDLVLDVQDAIDRQLHEAGLERPLDVRLGFADEQSLASGANVTAGQGAPVDGVLKFDQRFQLSVGSEQVLGTLAAKLTEDNASQLDSRLGFTSIASLSIGASVIAGSEAPASGVLGEDQRYKLQIGSATLFSSLKASATSDNSGAGDPRAALAADLQNALNATLAAAVVTGELDELIVAAVVALPDGRLQITRGADVQAGNLNISFIADPLDLLASQLQAAINQTLDGAGGAFDGIHVTVGRDGRALVITRSADGGGEALGVRFILAGVLDGRLGFTGDDAATTSIVETDVPVVLASSGLAAAQKKAPASGQLGFNQRFKIELGSEVVFGTLTKAATTDNTGDDAIAMLAADLEQALNAALASGGAAFDGISLSVTKNSEDKLIIIRDADGKGDLRISFVIPDIVAENVGNRIALSARPVVVPDADGIPEVSERRLEITINASADDAAINFADPALREMGLLSSPVRFDGRLLADAAFTLVVDGTSLNIEITKAATDDNTSIDDLIDDLNAAIEAAKPGGFDIEVQAVRIDASSGLLGLEPAGEITGNRIGFKASGVESVKIIAPPAGAGGG